MKKYSYTMIGFASLFLSGISLASWNNDMDPETAALIASMQAEEAGALDPETARLIQRLQQEDARRPVAGALDAESARLIQQLQQEEARRQVAPNRNNNNNNNIDNATQAEIDRIQAEEATLREIARIQAEEASAREIARLRAEEGRNNNNIDNATQAEIARILAQDNQANQGRNNANVDQHLVMDRFNSGQVRQNLTPALNGQLDQMQNKIAEICTAMVSEKQAVSRKPGKPNQFNPNDVQNVHKFNYMLKPYAGCLVEMNRLMGLKSDSPLEDCMRRLRVLRTGVLGQGNSNLGEQELIQLTNYLKKYQVVEKETGMHPLHLLSCLVDYLEKSPNQAVDVRIFFDRLVENTLEKGGCYPGYVGRMMACNIIYILRLFRNVEISIHK